LFFTFYSDMKPPDTKKASDNPKKSNDIEARLKLVILNIHILRRNPTSRWVDFKTTHQLDGCT